MNSAKKNTERSNLKECPFLDTINRDVLDFDCEKVLSSLPYSIYLLRNALLVLVNPISTFAWFVDLISKYFFYDYQFTVN